jgi:sec-independent protein translocase protein TatA
MGPFNHWPALLLVLVIVLIVWGPGKLPEIGSAVGKAMHEFRKQSSDFQDEIKRGVATREPEMGSRPASDVTPAASGADIKPNPGADIKPASSADITPPPTADIKPTAPPDIQS